MGLLKSIKIEDFCPPEIKRKKNNVFQKNLPVAMFLKVKNKCGVVITLSANTCSKFEGDGTKNDNPTVLFYFKDPGTSA